MVGVRDAARWYVTHPAPHTFDWTWLDQVVAVAEKAGLTDYVFRQIRNSAAIFALQADLNDGEFQQRIGWTKDDVREMRDLYTDKNQKIIARGADKLAESEKSGQWKSSTF